MTSECVISPRTTLGTVHKGPPREKKKKPQRDFFHFSFALPIKTANMAPRAAS